MQLIYIMGRGRSGSTFVGGLLGQSPDVINVGELAYSMSGQCGCAQPFSTCEFWQQVRADFEQTTGLDWDDSRHLIENQAHLAHFVRTWTASDTAADVQALRAVNEGLIQAIQRVSGKQYVLDTGKEVTRALFLMRHFPNVKFIHLIRSPIRFAASYFYRIKHTGVKMLRHEFHDSPLNALFLVLVNLNWVVGNLLAECIRLLSPARVLRVRYEDLCADPTRELRRIQAFLGCNLEPAIKAVEMHEPMHVGHIIGGNYRMHESRTFVFDPTVGDSRSLPRFYKWMAYTVTWSLMIFYGYTKRQS
jgi:hypothetical protein